MLTGLFKRRLEKQHVPLEDKSFEPVRTLKKEGILNIEEVEDRIGGGTVSGYYHFVRTERAEGEVLEIINETKGYAKRYQPSEMVKGVKLKIRDDGGVEGEVYFPEEFPSKLDRKAILNQRVRYKYESDRMCERCVGGDNRNSVYTLDILTGQLEGERYSQTKWENL